MRLTLYNNTLSQMKEHAEETFPNECCGFFFGNDGEQRHITHVTRVRNAKEGNQRRRFRIDPDDYREAEQFATDNDLDFLGIYHSHPNHPAEPSEHDRKVAMPFFSYVIVSVMEGKSSDVRSWRLNDRREFDEEPLEVNELKRNT